MVCNASSHDNMNTTDTICMQMTSREFQRFEVVSGPPLIDQISTRLPKPVYGRIQQTAMLERSSPSVIIRQALHEYFTRRGIDPFISV